ncbi:MAG: hypothetical protein JSV61_05150 [Anaerolineales bacterium]|nr:MAG: hypothetical protein JSV61_05150 [Anaerolineales bacterium]
MGKHILLHVLMISAVLLGLGGGAVVTEPALAQTTGAILYVNMDASGNCSAWALACDLQTALGTAKSGDEIWVQAGIYTPTTDINAPSATFQLRNGVAIYGGFAGDEKEREQRDWTSNITVLSGDIGGDDTTDLHGVVTDTANIVGENAYHVVFSSGVDTTAILDGFVITAGYASQTPPNIHGYGGGMFMQAGSPTLNNLVFSGNTAGKGAAYYGGGAMYISFASNPVLTHVTFVANTAGSAAGMFNDRGSNPVLNDVLFSGNKAIDASCMGNYTNSSPVLNGVVFDGNSSSNKGCMVNHENSNPTLTAVTFSNNSARYGSGMYNYMSSPTLTEVVFSNNAAGHVGGAIENETSSNPILNNVLFSGNSAYHQGGGMFNIVGSNPMLTNVAFINNTVTGDGGGGGIQNSNSSPILVNVTFSGNHAVVGGGIDNWQSNLALTNVTFSENTAELYGSAMYSQESKPTLMNTIIWGNTPSDSQLLGDSTVTYSIIAGGHPGTGNLNVNPLLDAFADNGGFSQTYALLIDSPAIDTGNLELCPESDQRGLPRPVDGDEDGKAICDMGAFEYQPPALASEETVEEEPARESLIRAQVDWELLTRVEIINKTEQAVSIILSGEKANYVLKVDAKATRIFTVERANYNRRTYACGNADTGFLDANRQVRLVFTPCWGPAPNRGEPSMEKIHIPESPEGKRWRYK